MTGVQTCALPILFFTGDSFGAEYAEEIGLVNYVAADPYQKAHEIAVKIAKQPPQAIINTKALMKANVHDSVAAVMKAEFEIFSLALQSDEAQAAFMKFMEKRKE